VSLSEYSCRFLINIHGEHTFAETADMSTVCGFAYSSDVAACHSYQEEFHTRQVPDKEKSVSSIECDGKEGMYVVTVAGR